jgi:hypothetical protein
VPSPVTREELERDLAKTHDPGIRHALNRYGSLAIVLNDWANRLAVRHIRDWLEQATLGYRFERQGAAIVGRAPGRAVVRFDDGRPDLTIWAPAPCI